MVRGRSPRICTPHTYVVSSFRRTRRSVSAAKYSPARTKTATSPALHGSRTDSAPSCPPDDDRWLETGQSVERFRREEDFLHRDDVRFDRREPALELQQPGPKPFRVPAYYDEAAASRAIAVMSAVLVPSFIPVWHAGCLANFPSVGVARGGRGRRATHSGAGPRCERGFRTRQWAFATLGEEISMSGRRRRRGGMRAFAERMRCRPFRFRQGRRIRGFEGARAPPERTSAPPHRQKHPLKIKEKVNKMPCDTKIEQKIWLLKTEFG